MVVAFIPYQLFIYPLVRVFSFTGLGQSLATIVIIHTIFGLPTMTLLFRNYFAALPVELFKAARVDGAGFYRIYCAHHDADGDADDRRRGDPADHRHLERLHPRASSSPAATTCR